MAWDPRVKAGIFAGESGGDYNALFGFSNRPGGRFADTRLTDMTVDQAIQFSDPNGPYAQWVKNQIGRVATPMGGFQVVGTTLRAMKDKMGLTGNERMTPELQDVIGENILAAQGTGAWSGYRGPRDPASIRTGYSTRHVGGAGARGAAEFAPSVTPPAPYGATPAYEAPQTSAEATGAALQQALDPGDSQFRSLATTLAEAVGKDSGGGVKQGEFATQPAAGPLPFSKDVPLLTQGVQDAPPMDLAGLFKVGDIGMPGAIDPLTGRPVARSLFG